MTDDAPLPAEVYIGTTEGTWPIYAFAQQELAIRWMQEADKGLNTGRVHLWLCRLDVQHELTVVPPSAPRLIPKYIDGWYVKGPAKK